MSRDVVVSGVGLISALGIGIEPTFEALVAGRTGTVASSSVEAGLVECPAIAPVTDFRARMFIPNRKSLKLMTRPVKLGVAAANLAFTNAGVNQGDIDPERLGTFVGAGQAFGDRAEFEHGLLAARGDDGFDMRRFGSDGIDLIHPLWLLRGLSNNVLGFVSLEHDAQGTNNNYCNSGISALQAIGEAARAIREGRLDAAVAGGYDTVCDAAGLLGYGRLGLLARHGADPKSSHRPFDSQRTGMVPAEAGAFVLLEAADHVKERGGRALARVVGAGVAADGLAIADADPDGGKIERAVAAALAEADRGPNDIAAVFAHGAASPFDAVELRAVQSLVGDSRRSEIRVTADKAGVGHSVAAAGGVSVSLAATALHRAVLPPIATLDDVDPECAGWDFVTSPASFEPASSQLVAVLAAGMGGQGASVLLAPCEP